MGDGTIPEVCTSSDPYSRFPSLNDESLRNSAREMKSARRRPAEVASRLRLPAAAQSLEDPWTALISRTVAVISEDDDMGDGTIPEVSTSSDPYSRFSSLNDD